MEKQKQQVAEVAETTKKESVDLMQLQIDALSNQLTELQMNYERISIQFTDLVEIAKNANKKIRNVDALFTKDITNRYGFSGEYMYYIGTGSGRFYKKTINDEIVNLIQRIDTLDWRGIQKINQHFMK